MKAEFYVGTYASECEEGILKVRADFESRTFTRAGGFTGIPNPSWVLVHPNGKMLYAVQEKNPGGRLSAFSVSENTLTLLHTWETDGADPCHISLDPQGAFLSVANYTSGSLAVFRLDAQGVPEGMGGFVQHTGEGTDPVRQEGPHIHFSMMHEGELFVTDLGLDRISRYRVDRRSGKLQESGQPVITAAGYGPRHFCFHPVKQQLLYVLTEMGNTLFVYAEQTDGSFAEIQRIRTLPEDFGGFSTAAAIRFSDDGRTLFTSNRGHDSITAFHIREDGTAEWQDCCLTGGKTPRDFRVFGNYLVTANQDGGGITVLVYDAEKGKLQQTKMRMRTAGKPVCISALQ